MIAGRCRYDGQIIYRDPPQAPNEAILQHALKCHPWILEARPQ